MLAQGSLLLNEDASMPPERPAGDGRLLPSRKPRHFLHIPFTAQEYETITVRAAMAHASRSRYVREAALAVQIFRSPVPRERLPHVVRVIACLRTLTRAVPATVAELKAAAAELELHSDELAAQLALVPRDPDPPLDPAPPFGMF
jgi:hypothetical protein